MLIAVFANFDHPLERQLTKTEKHKYELFMNSPSPKRKKFDVVISFGDIKHHLSVDADKRYFIVGEPAGIAPNYPSLKGFDAAFSFREDIDIPIISSFVPFPWHLGIKRMTEKKPKYGLIMPYPEERKNKVVILGSTKNMFQGHKHRLEIIERIKSEFSDIVDFIPAPFEDKAIIKDYKYHICIENSVADDYITEKLTDCILAGCYPIYYGAKNVNKYFHEIRSNDSLFDTLREIRSGKKLFEESQKNRHSNYLLVKYHFNFFPYIEEVLKNVL